MVMGRRPHLVVGLTFGRLTIIATSRKMLASQNRNRYVVAKCQCGTTTAVRLDALKSGHIQSCGCLAAEQTSLRLKKNNHQLKHGHAKRTGKTSEYIAWWGMVQRCEYPKHNGFEYYGGRGIKICNRWRYGENGATGFQCFLADMGRRPSNGHSVDRINNDGDYEPANCRWATWSEQALNKTRRS
jgi:hypothetical protein